MSVNSEGGEEPHREKEPAVLRAPSGASVPSQSCTGPACWGHGPAALCCDSEGAGARHMGLLVCLLGKSVAVLVVLEICPTFLKLVWSVFEEKTSCVFICSGLLLSLPCSFRL